MLTHEQPSTIEKEQPYVEKHNKWFQEAKIAVQSLFLALGAAVGSEIVIALLPPELNIPELRMLPGGLAGGFAATSYIFSSRE